VGDPFTEKLLLEASLELIASGVITGIQDMGAAGITSSASEMAGRAGNGVELEMSRVPVREPGMTPYEILLSESQERMLVVAEKGREHEVRRILEKWELEAAEIGTVTDDGRFRVLEEVSTEHFMPSMFARKRDSSAAAVSKTLRQLVDRGLVSSTISRDDGRYRRYVLTSKGKRVMVSLRALRAEAITDVWTGLDAGDLREFTRFGNELTDRLETYAGSEGKQ